MGGGDGRVPGGRYCIVSSHGVASKKKTVSSWFEMIEAKTYRTGVHDIPTQVPPCLRHACLHPSGHQSLLGVRVHLGHHRLIAKGRDLDVVEVG
jgi:hypothetical protein